MVTDRKKILCRKCNRNYYLVGLGKSSCPYCHKEGLIPDGTVAIMQLKIQPGGYDNSSLCLDGGLATKAKSGVIYLRCRVTVLTGKHKDSNFSIPISLSINKGDYWQKQGRELIRGILNSSQGLSPSDNSRKAVFSRIVDNYDVLDGICFVGVIGVHKSRIGREENTIPRALSADDKVYRELVLNKTFVPAQKVPPPSEPTSPMWRRV